MISLKALAGMATVSVVVIQSHESCLEWRNMLIESLENERFQFAEVGFDVGLIEKPGSCFLQVYARSVWSLFRTHVISFNVDISVSTAEVLSRLRPALLSFPKDTHDEGRLIQTCTAPNIMMNAPRELLPLLGWRLHAMPRPQGCEFKNESNQVLVRVVTGMTVTRVSDLLNVNVLPTVSIRSTSLCVPSFSQIAKTIAGVAVNAQHLQIHGFPPEMRGGRLRIQGDVLPCRSIATYMDVLRSLCASPIPFDFFDNVFWQSRFFRAVLKRASKGCSEFRLSFSRGTAFQTRVTMQSVCALHRQRVDENVCDRFLFISNKLNELALIRDGDAEKLSLESSQTEFGSPLRWLNNFLGGGCAMRGGGLEIVVSSKVTIVFFDGEGTDQIERFLVASELAHLMPKFCTNREASIHQTKLSFDARVTAAVVERLGIQPKSVPRQKHKREIRRFLVGDENDDLLTVTNEVTRASTPRKVARASQALVKRLLNIASRFGELSVSFSNVTGITLSIDSPGTHNVLWSSARTDVPPFLLLLEGAISTACAQHPRGREGVVEEVHEWIASATKVLERDAPWREKGPEFLQMVFDATEFTFREEVALGHGKILFSVVGRKFDKIACAAVGNDPIDQCWKEVSTRTAKLVFLQ